MIGSIPFSLLVKITYAVTALICVLTLIQAKKSLLPLDKQHEKFWQILAVLFILLTLNHAYGVIPKITQLFRELAISQRLYSIRGPLQIQVTVTTIFFWAIIILVLLFRIRRMMMRYKLVLLQLGLLLAVLLADSVSYHYTDRLLGVRISGIRVFWLLQAASLIHIGGTALFALLEKQGGRKMAVDSGVIE
jgi:hypothetical protein